MARTSSKIVNNIPNTENGRRSVCFTEPNQSGDKYLITECSAKGQWTLWKCVKEGFEKIKTANSPLCLDEYVPYKHVI